MYQLSQNDLANISGSKMSKKSWKELATTVGAGVLAGVAGAALCSAAGPAGMYYCGAKGALLGIGTLGLKSHSD